MKPVNYSAHKNARISVAYRCPDGVRAGRHDPRGGKHTSLPLAQEPGPSYRRPPWCWSQLRNMATALLM